MTATALAPTRTTPTGRAFVRAYRGVGRARVHAAVIAAGVGSDGQPQRLVLPVERVATVDVRHLPTAAAFTANLNSASERSRPQARLAEQVMTTLAGRLHVTGPLTGAVRLPGAGDGGADLDSATALAAVEAFSAATEQPVPAEVVTLALAEAGVRAGAPAVGGVNLHDPRSGAALTSWESFPRFYTVFAHRIAGAGGIPTTDLATAGALEELPTTIAGLDEVEVAASLERASRPADPGASAVRALFEDVHARGLGSLAVVGGHEATDPVALLLPTTHASLLVAQRLHTVLAKLLAERVGPRADPGWWVTIARLAGS